MANDPNAPDVSQGTSQVPPEGTSTAPPQGTEGRAEGAGAPADGRAPAPEADLDLGVDPSTLPPEVKGLWDQTHRQMKSTFTKRMQELGQYREKVQAYDQFMADPVGQLQTLASQYGYSVTRAQAAQAIQQQAQSSAEWDGSGDPPSWDAVLSRAKQLAREDLVKEFGPVLQNVQKLQAKSVEQQLESLDPDWRMYESDMRSILKVHPTLAQDIPTLYRMALPPEVIQQRAMKEAQEKLRASASAARVGSTQTKTTQPAPVKVESFDDAVREAKRLISQGKR